MKKRKVKAKGTKKQKINSILAELEQKQLENAQKTLPKPKEKRRHGS